MRGERLKEIVGELRELVDKAQDALDDRPVLQRLLTALKEKIAQADEEEAENAEDEEAEPC